MAKRDYYEVLGVERTATPTEVRTAYRRLAARYHPDVNPGDHEAEEKFKELNEANEVLSSAEKREVYDQFGHDGPQSGMGGADGFGVGDIFDMFFGAGGGTGARPGGAERARQQATQGTDLRYDLEITLEEAAYGVERNLKLSRLQTCDTCGGGGARAGTSPQTCPTCNGAGQMRQVQNTILGSFATVTPCSRCRGEGRVIADPCPTCHGQGRLRRNVEHAIRVPAGVDTGTRLVDQGAGDTGVRGGQPGDLYVVIYVQAHPQLTRRGRDVVHEAKVTFAQAALGDTFEVPVLGGTDRLTIPEGTQPGATFRLRGRGLPEVNSRSQDRGDEIVVIGIHVPPHLNDEQRRLLKEFAAVSGEKLTLDERSLFEKVKDTFSNNK